MIPNLKKVLADAKKYDGHTFEIGDYSILYENNRLTVYRSPAILLFMIDTDLRIWLMSGYTKDDADTINAIAKLCALGRVAVFRGDHVELSPECREE